MKKLILFLLPIAICQLLIAQVPSPGQQDFTARSITFNLADPPQPVPFASVSRVGNPGPATFYYWIVSNYAVGNSSPAGPFAGLLGPNSFSASNGFTISWAPAVGAVSYDILRTALPVSPSGACNCAVATAVTSLSTTDQSNSLNSYTVASFDPSTATVQAQNKDGILNFNALAASAAAFASSGVFANLAMSFGLQSNVNGCNPLTQFQLNQGNTRFSADALTGCLTIPSTSTEYQANAVTGYVINSSPNTNAVGLFSFAECNASNTFCWGGNPTVGTLGSPANATLHGLEVDTANGAGSTNTIITGVSVAGTWNAAPGLAQGFSVSPPVGSAGTKWSQGFVTQSACCFTGILLSPLNTGNGVTSQSLTFNGTDGSGVTTSASINSDAVGDLIITPAANKNMVLASGGIGLPGGAIVAADASNSGGMRWIGAGTNQSISISPSGTGTIIGNSPIDYKEIAAPAGIAAFDRCYGDSTAHALKCSYNNGSFLNIPQVIASGTATFTTTAVGAGACQTTVTVTATGAATTDGIETAYASAPGGVTDSLLILNKWVTAGNVNFSRCNPTAGSITPTALVLNWKVIR
ncbi:MAG TPA: hypothetical protein VJN64_11705 [Terriglobales bacterium]|nr:hypothetical protein [Terriglobales bacterium]